MKAVDDLNAVFHQLWRRSGWTRARIARELGVNYSSVYRWETGETKPEPSKLMLLARLIGEPVQIGATFTAADPQGPVKLDDGEIALLAELRRIPQPARSEFVKGMRSMMRAAAQAESPNQPQMEADRRLELAKAAIVKAGIAHVRSKSAEAELAEAATVSTPESGQQTSRARRRRGD